MALKLAMVGQRRYRHLGRAIARQRSFIVDADGACNNLTLLFAPGLLLLTAAALMEQAMYRKPYSLSKQLVVATALALGASSVALADDSSMNPFTAATRTRTSMVATTWGIRGNSTGPL